MIIAIDGPAGSGKSTTAKAVARELGFRHLDSGAFYRAITHAALLRGLPVDAWARLAAPELDALGVEAQPSAHGFRMFVDGVDVGEPIRTPGVTAQVSAMARVPAVRTWLLDRLRAAARDNDLVADGRDIGTVVFPDAELKIFLIADPRARAERRLRQMGRSTAPLDIDEEESRIAERDRIDSNRDVAPLRPADDVILLDTTALHFDEQVRRIVDLARARM